jgi:hypothetical protein
MACGAVPHANDCFPLIGAGTDASRGENRHSHPENAYLFDFIEFILIALFSGNVGKGLVATGFFSGL